MSVPMNREQRRAVGVKLTPETAPYQIVLVGRHEITRQDGSMVAVSYFTPVTANGKALMEDAGVDGPLPIVFESRPIVVKRASKIVVVGR